MMERWQVLEATEVGTSHIDAGENQGDDACASDIINNGEVCILTVADGAGSAELARVGAQTAVNAIIEAAQAKFIRVRATEIGQPNSLHNLPREAADWDSVITDIVLQARDKITRKAKKYENKLASRISNITSPEGTLQAAEESALGGARNNTIESVQIVKDEFTESTDTEMVQQNITSNDELIDAVTDDGDIVTDNTATENIVTDEIKAHDIVTNDITDSQISPEHQMSGELSSKELSPDTVNDCAASKDTHEPSGGAGSKETAINGTGSNDTLTKKTTAHKTGSRETITGKTASAQDPTVLGSENTIPEGNHPAPVQSLSSAKQTYRRHSINNIKEHYAASNKAANPLAKFATTTLGVIITSEWLVSWQIGDGVIVLRDSKGYRAITTPAKGEYANQTHFLTGEGFSKKMQIFTEKRNPKQAISGVVLMTDGLERLAMQMQDNTPFIPFFDNLFAFAENSEVSLGERQAGLQNTLRSDAVNQRTDDDKTIMVAFLESL